MLNWLFRWFGREDKTASTSQSGIADPSSQEAIEGVSVEEEPAGVTETAAHKEADAELEDEVQVATYERLLEEVETEQRREQYRNVLHLCIEAIRYLPAVIRQKGELDTIPPINVACQLISAYGSKEEWESIRNVVEEAEQLHPWRSTLDRALEELVLVEGVLQTVHENPGIVQRDIKGSVNVSDGRRIATLCQTLEKAERIRREKIKGSFRVYPADPVKDENSQEERVA